MDILKALRAEESKFMQQLDTIRAAIKLLGGMPPANTKHGRSARARKKMSAEGRARIAAAQKKRWAAIRKAKKAKTK
jgi:hypothetical protein